MRLFVAVLPPAEALAELDQTLARSGVREAAVDLRWTPPEQWHLTLTFFGEVDEERLPALRDRLSAAARRHQPLPARIAKVATFGSSRRANVLWAGVESEGRGLARLAQSVVAAGRRAGLDAGSHRFRPHLTLARARRPGDLSSIAAVLAGYRGPAWTVTEICLVRSTLNAGSGGRPVYDVLDRWRLRPG
jgi:RNA 2',3'-cyclic 3'-phosphodiesterase